jgi:hypothetical protein
MGGFSDRERPQSLGSWLAALRPGDQCPWCGGPLKAGQRTAGGPPTPGPAGTTVSSTALVCGCCGCVVDAGDGSFDPGCASLGHAA